MSTESEILTELNTLNPSKGWETCADHANRVEARTGPCRLLVETMPNGHALWFVDHERYGVLQSWTPEQSPVVAKLQAMSFIRAYALSGNC